jgi:hypothetical protein
MTANVVAPTGQVETVHLRQQAPGRYEASFRPQLEGAYFIRLAGEDETADIAGGPDGPAGCWATRPNTASLSRTYDLLARLADLTGGQNVAAIGTAVFCACAPGAGQFTRPVWPWLTLLALLLLPVDVGLRRLVVTRQDMARLWQWLFGRFRPAAVPAPEQPEPVARLFAAKRRAFDQRSQSAASPLPELPAAENVAVEPEKRPSAPAEKTADTPDANSLAARLLRQKQAREKDENG